MQHPGPAWRPRCAVFGVTLAVAVAFVFCGAIAAIIVEAPVVPAPSAGIGRKL